MNILFDNNYPKAVVEALKLIHSIGKGTTFTVTTWTKGEEAEKPIVFIMDRSKTGIDVTTTKHFEAGYQVFAFKLNPGKKLDMFDLALTVLNLWPKVLETVSTDENPFVYTYRYGGRKLRKIN